MESLIQHLTTLYHEISARLLQLRVSRAQIHPAATEAGLLDALVERLQAVATAGAREAGTAQGGPRAGADAVKGAEAAVSPGRAPGAGPPLPPIGERPPNLSREPGAAGLHPPLATQLQRQTLRYVGEALDLARQGRADLAESCARYAESSLRLAAQHLPAEEYEGFRDQVLARLVRSSSSSTPSNALRAEG